MRRESGIWVAMCQESFNLELYNPQCSVKSTNHITADDSREFLTGRRQTLL